MVPLWNLRRNTPRHPPRGRHPARRRCPMNAALNRRSFLRTSAAAAGGLLVGFYIPERTKATAGILTDSKLNAWVHVGSDDEVTLFIHKAEMGQGTVTSLSMQIGRASCRERVESSV